MNARGFALVAVLWTVVLLSGVVGLGVATTRLGQRTTSNRLVLARARWAAEACLAIAEGRAARNALPDSATIDLGRTTSCSWTIEHPDARLDLNTAPRSALVGLGTQLGVPPDSAERFAETVVGSRRAAAFTDVGQIASLLPGASRVLPYVTMDGSGRVDANTASPSVLASLPGITPEAVELLVRRREAGTPAQNVDELAGGLSPAGRAALLAGYADLAPMLTFGSRRLVVIAEGGVDSQGRSPATRIEAVVERLPDRLAVLRRRMR